MGIESSDTFISIAHEVLIRREKDTYRVFYLYSYRKVISLNRIYKNYNIIIIYFVSIISGNSYKALSNFTT